NHLFGDMVWRELAIQNQSLYYHPDVYITHEHKINGMSQEEYRGEKYERDDRKAFVTWLMAGMMSDVNKIKHAKRNNLCAK
ncbi:hypothetical protein U2054_15690, partial [Listeria monocytogenes]|uniref:hypothetical protein n=1 Tax=Listeria monocytogenes TaxID=1639 RepID=UPI002FDBE4C8